MIFIASIPPPVTGESIINEAALKHFACGRQVQCIDTNIAEFAIAPGAFSLKKFFLALRWQASAICKILRSHFECAYIVSGQTRGGILRFLPVIGLCLIKCSNVTVHFHGSAAPVAVSAMTRVEKFLVRKLYRKVKVVVLSARLVESHAHALDARVSVVENFVPQRCDSLHYERIDQLSSSEIKCLFMSNLMTEKGLFIALEAMIKVHKNFPNVSLTICGGGSPEVVRQLLCYRDAHDWIHYEGLVTGAVKSRILGESHIFLLPTFYPIEGMPISILEAAQAQCLIITTDQGAIGDFIVDGKTGRITRKRDPEDLCNVLSEVLSSTKDVTPLLNEASLQVRIRYTQDLFSKRLDDVIQGVSTASEKVLLTLKTDIAVSTHGDER